ncbi:phosphoadenosine phosphosulfate reductase family protein [Rossellomorea marisflavi]|uniref:phosphoadenosine phosphosulfate reductase family protein n=1 Tax=Rossellomorea marisflavi TaxID=189381 RepID=UPI0025AFDDA7|nr:phosphoadenosine phosphosulfate reductase family protein [Rossellomorea marisflavi]WJV20825.1 phosphoadenosine phosphosulfate reductase family protein [Rossellomorea marisflavi]
MSKINEYNELATNHFEEKKFLDAKLKKDKKGRKEYEGNEFALEIVEQFIKSNKELIKFHKAEFEKYDTLAYKEMKKENVDVSKMYLDQTKKGTTKESRADRSVRYYHYRDWNTASLEEKERWGIDLVKASLQRSANPVVSCSFGIDSIVTLYITRKALEELGRDPSEIQVIWNDTLNEFPEVRMYANQLVKDWNLNLIVSKPKMPLKKVIEKHGGVDSSYFFTRKGDRRNGRPLSEKCCGTLKHEPMKRAINENNWDLVINGLRSDESTQRLRAGLRDGEYFYSNTEWKAFVCRPIMWMTEEDIWDYVEIEKIPYNDLYDQNTIKKYPQDLESVIKSYIEDLHKTNIDIDKLKAEQLSKVTKKQAFLLEKIGFKIYTPRTGCMQCPVGVKYGYLQWMRLTHPKIYNSMIHSLGYGKALLGMIPDDVKEEIEFVMGIDLSEDNAHEFMKDILETKPCVFDKF